jgi:hypothetical protein
VPGPTRPKSVELPMGRHAGACQIGTRMARYVTAAAEDPADSTLAFFTSRRQGRDIGAHTPRRYEQTGRPLRTVRAEAARGEAQL